MAAAATRVYLFHMRACHSGAAFAMAFPHCSQQAFLEAHVQAFDWFGGVFGLVRYDNLASRCQAGAPRPPACADRPVHRAALALSLRVAVHDPRGRGHHEKGGVEGEVGRFRRRHLVPVPEVSTLAELNARLLAGCEMDLHRRIAGRPETVGEAFARERPLLRGLPAEEAHTAEQATPRVNAKALVTIKQNSYSVPVAPSRATRPFAGGRSRDRVASRRRAGRAPRAAAGPLRRVGAHSTTIWSCSLASPAPGWVGALSQERERGAWPSCFDELWAKITERYGPSEAARQMVDVLMLAREHGAREIELAVRGALAAGAHDGRAVAVLAGRAAQQEAGDA